MAAHIVGNLPPQEAKRDDVSKTDIVAVGVVVSAILLFVATGTVVGPRVVASMAGTGPGPDSFILNAFLLNIAILVFGLSRYRQLNRELQDRKAAEREARRLADTDSLTGFLNRRSFNACADLLIDASKNRGQIIIMVMIDIDNFKQINDFNGHNFGDLVLRECAARIAGSLPPTALIGRVGGDEFAAAFAIDGSRPRSIEKIAVDLSAAISRTVTVDEIDIELSAAIGLCRSDQHGMDKDDPHARELLEMADMAMYHAKRLGRNSYLWFEARMADEVRFRIEMERDIRQGIALGEFVPFYEQQINLQTGELVGFEMLARWQSPSFGLVSPDIFIPVAEEIGVIGDLSESVIRQALEDAKSWDPGLTLAVNISPLQLRDPWFSQKLLRLLVEANYPPHRLEIEITESCLHQNIAQVRSLITSLKNQGIQISLDDFGTGYSSLAQLRSLPFDRIKIDRSFISNLIDNSDNAAIVHAIAMLGKGMNLPITAEGIETGEVLEHLLQYGQIKGQGYLYGKPRPAAEITAWLKQRSDLGLAEAATTSGMPQIVPATDDAGPAQGILPRSRHG